MWKYRLFKVPITDPGNIFSRDIYEVREVLYSKEGMPIAYSEEVVSPFGFDVDDVQNNLILMLSDVNEGMLNSQIYKREDFRHKSLISDIVNGGIFGLGPDGYILAIISMQKLLKNEN